MPFRTASETYFNIGADDEESLESDEEDEEDDLLTPADQSAQLK